MVPPNPGCIQGPDVLIVGRDRISQCLLHRLGDVEGLVVAVDASQTLKRVVRLLARGSLRASDVVQMARAEFSRPRYRVRTPISYRVRTNADLLDLIESLSPRRVYLFRAGLIIGRRVIERPTEVLNFHCASIPDHGGLASIRRALEDGALDQSATLHRVTERIDDGNVLRTLPYRLDPDKSYTWNEALAYETGIRLAIDVLTQGRDAVH